MEKNWGYYIKIGYIGLIVGNMLYDQYVGLFSLIPCWAPVRFSGLESRCPRARDHRCILTSPMLKSSEWTAILHKGSDWSSVKRDKGPGDFSNPSLKLMRPSHLLVMIFSYNTGTSYSQGYYHRIGIGAGSFVEGAVAVR